MTEFDYIIVGAGTAGCVLAARLTQDPGTRVLLLEAGSPERTRAMTVPDAWPGLLGTAADWADVTTAQADAGPVAYPRGRGAGRVRRDQRHGPHPRPPHGLRRLGRGRGHRVGIPGAAALLPAQRARRSGRDPALRGTRGPVRVAPVPEADRHPVAVAFAAALARVGCPVTGDLSGPEQEGVAWPDLAIAGGQRVSPADAYLASAMGRPNLTVRPGCLATGLQVRDGRCTGVSYLHGGARAEAHTSGEVIVCAGAVGSPHLLLLSGIGPAAQLRALGIDPAADLPGVGENLQDHPIALACYATPAPLPRSRYNHGEMYAALRSPLAGACPDLHLFPILLPLAPAGRQPPDAGFALVAAVVAPDSRGTVRLATADPQMAPVINPGFLRDGRDTDRLEAGLAVIRQAAANLAFFSQVRAAEVHPGPASPRPPGCGSTSGARSAATGTRPAPAGSGATRTRARWWTPSCGSAGSPGCGSPTPRSCR